MEDRDAWSVQGVYDEAPGIHRLPLPLPGDGLKAVNVYAIEQSDGVVLIDSGWALGKAHEHLATALETLGHDFDAVTQIFVTHVHRDHYELGTHLQRDFGSRLFLGRGERRSLEDLRSGSEPGKGPMHSRLSACGAQPLLQRLREARDRRGPQPPIDWRLPDEWLDGGMRLQLENRTLDVVATPGHTQGHVVFIDHENGLLFSGDHILPHITPSIGFEHVPAESPLADYLASLALVRGMEDLRMLPAHGPTRATTHDRIDELFAHHDHRLDLSQKAVHDGATTAYEVARVLPWTRRETAFDDMDPFNQMLAVNETAAHLDVLVRDERLGATDVDGIRHYRI